MKIFADIGSIRLQSYDPEEVLYFKEEAEALGLTVKENKLKHLDAFGDESKLYLLIFSLTLKFKVEIH